MKIEKQDGVIIVYNNVIPFKGFKCINICGIVFARNDENLDEENINHEKTHSVQIFEMLVIGFYLWYVIEWLIKLIIYKNASSAYEQISFEKEAHANDKDAEYLSTRKHYSWISYL